ncbi:MAG: DUF952 domain-containing protein [Alphaproteobacteria bacterium]|nr:DUF952 domain-containing protein [Alphaproteobacteria bacterium]
MAESLIYHMCRRDEWDAACGTGVYRGSSQDEADGFIHFSTADQIAASAAKHRAGQSGLVLIEVDASRLGDALRWEPARDGALFPHLYGVLAVDSVTAVRDLPVDREGRHLFPALPLPDAPT